MTADSRQRASELFHAAFDLAPDDRLIFLQRACVDDAALWAEVESLLRYAPAAAGFPASARATIRLDRPTTTRIVQRRISTPPVRSRARVR
jgi:hypothetical protein